MVRIPLRLRFAGLIAVGLAGATSAGWTAETDNTPATIERGRYIAQLAGCNDCHTPGYLLNNGDIPESRWLIGDTFGWRGPWGTTYPSNLRLFLKYYVRDGKSTGVIEGIKRVSRPGRRVFAGKDNIPKVCGGYGISILSTNQGILTGHQCRMRGIGGEVLCEVW